MIKKESGITLIALVITIIVLLILASISIATLVGENGILTQANTAKQETERAEVIERVRTDVLGIQAKNEGNLPIDEFKKDILEKYFNELSDDLLSMETELTTKEEYGNYKILVSEIYKGESLINKLKAGDYVYYIDKNGTKRKCVVLYDSTSQYGVQIVTESTVTNVNLSGTNYNNAIKILNDKANEYLNKTYAKSARCVGSVPDNPYSESTSYYTSGKTFMKNYNGKYKKGDKNYEQDNNTMGKLKIKNSSDGNSYWLASRVIYETTDCRI